MVIRQSHVDVCYNFAIDGELEEFERTIRSQLGFNSDIEIVVFNFIALQSSPFQGAITDKGLIDVYAQKIIPLIK